MHTAICRPLLRRVDAVHVDGIAINESMPLPLAAVHWGKPQQPTLGPKTRRHGMAWHGIGHGAWGHTSERWPRKKVSRLEGTTEEIPSLAPINGAEPDLM